MKASVNWLRELTELELDAAELEERLTLSGLEVEGRTAFGAFAGVVVAEVRGKCPHPKANKLTLVDVWDGAAVTQVVCGAANVPDPGGRVLWARPGARLASGMILEPKEIRGIVSPGMLAAEDELGFSAAHEGIIVLAPEDGLAVGADLGGALGLPDDILEVNVTPNRPDCLGHVGIAREVCAIYEGRRFSTPELESVSADAAEPPVAVEILDPEGCPRYLALLVRDVRVGPSPLKQRLRLLALGIRPISNVVDATNIVLLERSQPLHAFDLSRLAGERIVVRRARAGETIQTLDGETRRLEPADLVICDAERPVAVAGVMGGAASEVSASTRQVLLESAMFAPALVRRTARRLGLHTEASHRFERGVDPNGVESAAVSAGQLIARLARGRVGAATDVYPSPAMPRPLALRPGRARQVLGFEIPVGRQAELLSRLGLEVAIGDERIEAVVPTFRPDLQREIDLIEEVARLEGFDSVPTTVPTLRQAPGTSGDTRAETVRDVLKGLGLDEAITYGFASPAHIAAFGFVAHDPRGRPIKLKNPLREEQSVLRTSLLFGLLQALNTNLLRGRADARLFEVGEVFLEPGGIETPEPGGGRRPEERRRVAAVLAGAADGWLKPGPRLDYFDVKGIVEELLDALGVAAAFEPSNEPFLHPGVQAQVLAAGKAAGTLGELHPVLQRKLGLDGGPMAFELDLEALGASRPVVTVELERFPAVTRDLSFFIAEGMPAKELVRAIAAVEEPLRVGFRVLEDYREPGKVPAGKKGMLWSFTYRAPDRTLTDEEVQTRHEMLVARLKQIFGIEPR